MLRKTTRIFDVVLRKAILWGATIPLDHCAKLFTLVAPGDVRFSVNVTTRMDTLYRSQQVLPIGPLRKRARRRQTL
jgi:hypothetical protein